MKKILVTALAVVMMTVGIVGTASATPIQYTDTNDKIDTWIWHDRTVSWEMKMPIYFSMPPDTLKSAELFIYSMYVDSDTNEVRSIINTVVGSLSKTDDNSVDAIKWNFLNADNNISYFDVATFITPSWEGGAPLNVSLTADISINSPANWYFIDKAVLVLNFDDFEPLVLMNGVSNPPQETAAPVPEPGTMALLGFGLLGLAIYGKRRMNRDA